jgi:hypothetical protein
MKLALKHKKDLSVLGSATQGVEIQQGLSIGALLVLQHVAKSTGVMKALGNTHEGKLALFQVFARIIDQGSRLSATRLCNSHDIAGVIGISDFDKNDLYANLDWMTEKQDKIEDALYRFSHPETENKNELFLYDVTSSYLEGEANELAEFGYNRDKKSGKRQIVLGLLCDQDGYPISIQVFCGNTNDTQTFKDQADKVAARFGGGSVTLVGDGGMIKSPQIEDLDKAGFHYITSIGKAQINTLINNDVLQLSLFDNDLHEIIREDEGVRYILRRNPYRMAEIRETREEKLIKLQRCVDKQNLYLTEHTKAKPDTHLSKLQDKIKTLSLGGFVEVEALGRVISLKIDPEKRTACEQLDGCYVIKTDLPTVKASKEIVHARYKALSHVEHAFRTFKTGHLELRPIYVRKESRTRGHALVVMLAYRLVQELTKLWSALNCTVEEGLATLGQYCTAELTLGGITQGGQVQKPNAKVAALFNATGVELPKAWPAKKEPQQGKIPTKTTLKKNKKSS